MAKNKLFISGIALVALLALFVGLGEVRKRGAAGAEEIYAGIIDDHAVYLFVRHSADEARAVPGISEREVSYIEKRRLSDGSIDRSFGKRGKVAIPAGGSVSTILGGHIYIYTDDGIMWRADRYRLSDGKHDPAFRMIGELSRGAPVHFHGDEVHLYIAGEYRLEEGGGRELFLEKRRIDDGGLVSEFGDGGVVTAPFDNGRVRALAFGDGFAYVLGSDADANGWAIEKRSAESGSLTATFRGSVPEGAYEPLHILTYGDAFLMAGYSHPQEGADGARAPSGWRIEKRDAATGALVPVFADSGALMSETAMRMMISDGALYLSGGISDRPMPQSVLEKRSLETGVLDSAFGDEGAIELHEGIINIRNGSIYLIRIGDDGANLEIYDGADGTFLESIRLRASS